MKTRYLNNSDMTREDLTFEKIAKTDITQKIQNTYIQSHYQQ